MIAIGSGTLDVRDDDVVLFPAFVGTEVDLDGRKVIVVAEKELIAIVKRTDKPF